jgi:hypothetical protein
LDQPAQHVHCAVTHVSPCGFLALGYYLLQRNCLLGNSTLAEPATHSDTVSFLWASERSGFQHLYLYQVVTSTLFADETKLAIGDVGESAVDGAATLVRQLTGGNYHIFDIIRVDEKHGWVYFDANVGSPLYHQLCRVNLRDPTAPFAIHHQSDAENIAFLPSVAEVGTVLLRAQCLVLPKHLCFRGLC